MVAQYHVRAQVSNARVSHSHLVIWRSPVVSRSRPVKRANDDVDSLPQRRDVSQKSASRSRSGSV